MPNAQTYPKKEKRFVLKNFVNKIMKITSDPFLIQFSEEMEWILVN